MQSLELTSFAIALALLVLPVHVIQAQGSNLQKSIRPKTIEGNGAGICPPGEELEAVRNEIRQEIQILLEPTITCGGTTGWSRYFYLNASNSSEQCPSPLIEYTYDGKRVCGRTGSDIISTMCASVILQGNHSQPYSEVCGRIIGYQYGCTQAFGFYAELKRNNPPNTIDQYYVDGATLTHGPVGGREHIWTFASGVAETHNYYACPCSPSGLGLYNASPPPFVGDDYFCESGSSGTWPGQAGYSIFYGSDPLWDGAGCSVGNACCSLNNPPYFTKQLSTNTTDDIEMRICGRLRAEPSCDTLIQLIELYVK